jgi:hypothetical protein
MPRRASPAQINKDTRRQKSFTAVPYFLNGCRKAAVSALKRLEIRD